MECAAMSSSAADAADGAAAPAAPQRQPQQPQQRRLRVLGAHVSRHPTEGYAAAAYHTLCGVTPASALHAGHLVSKVLAAHGVRHVFCLSGGHISPILVAAEEDGIRVVDVRHEVNAVFAADASARLTGIPGVAAVTAGPGVTNTITAVKNAEMAQVPLVLLGGAAATIMKGRGSLQDINQRDVLAPIVKKCYTVTTVRDIVPMLREAFQVAASGVPGPVFVELPLDCLYCPLDIMVEMGWYERSRCGKVLAGGAALVDRVVVPQEADEDGLDRDAYLASLRDDATVFLEPARPNPNPWFVRLYLAAKLKYIHGNSPVVRMRSDPPDFSPLPVHIPMPQAADVAKVAALLGASRRPVLVLGSQTTIEVTFLERLVAAVDSLGIPTFLGGMARGLLGRNGRCFVRQGRTNALAESDCVILAGSVADFRLQYGRALPGGGVPICAVNRSAEMLGLNTDLYWKPTVASQSDPCHFILALAAAAAVAGGGGSVRDPEWLPLLKQREQAKERETAAKAREPAFGTGARKGQRLINPLHLFHELEKSLPDKSVLVADGGDFVATAAYTLRPRGPLSWLDPGAYGTLGVGGGFALAAGLLFPDAEIWIIWGDGSAGYSVAEFDTYARHGVPVMALVGNDACWTQIEREQTPMFGSATACELAYCAYEDVARGYGGAGLLVDDPSQDIAAVLAEARAHRAAGRPVLLNVHIGKTDFREGSISV